MSSYRPPDDPATDSVAQSHVSRRLFLKSSLAATAGAGVSAPAMAMAQDATPAATPMAMPGSEEGAAFKFFNSTEAAVIEALTARILPGTPDDPGAREAGVVYFIDNALHGADGGYSVKTYTHGPYLIVSEAQASPEVTSRPTLYEVQAVNTEELATRYGYQAVMPPQEIFRRGVESALAYAQSKHKSAFDDLNDDQIDQMLEDMEADKADTFNAPSGSAFFGILRNYTIEGMFSDPMYGGNRDMVGWKLIGYPGPRGHYTADDMQNADFHVAPVSLADMTMSNQ